MSKPQQQQNSHNNYNSNSQPFSNSGERFVVGTSGQPEYNLPLNSSFGLKPSSESEIMTVGRVYSENNSIVNTIISAPPTTSSSNNTNGNNNSNNRYPAMSTSEQTNSQPSQPPKRGGRGNNGNIVNGNNSNAQNKPSNSRNASSFRKQEQWQVKQKPATTHQQLASGSSESERGVEDEATRQKANSVSSYIDENNLPNYMRPTASTMKYVLKLFLSFFLSIVYPCNSLLTLRRQEAIQQEKAKKKESQLAEIAHVQQEERRELTVPVTPDFVRRYARDDRLFV
jgi:hypothetical protein